MVDKKTQKEEQKTKRQSPTQLKLNRPYFSDNLSILQTRTREKVCDKDQPRG